MMSAHYPDSRRMQTPARHPRRSLKCQIQTSGHYDKESLPQTGLAESLDKMIQGLLVLIGQI
jgi:hypothetical protein